uniref:Translation initiation factor IF-2, chloroplastic n=1 Tax=Rhodogorgon sp. TaxID=2485824 RepID=A0A3G3MI30_9FLOR|nr:translation initiation factor 2 [Rhodogorgon sp.]
MNNYEFVKPFLCNKFSSRCLGVDKYKSILHLQSPKVLSGRINQNERVYVTNAELAENIRSDLTIANDLYMPKGEKRNKLSSKIIDSLESKKYKAKQKKKARKKIDLDEDLEINDSQSLSLIKLPKNIRHKKDSKSKLGKNMKSDNLMVNENIESKRSSTISNSVSKEICFDRLLTVEELATQLYIPSTEIIKWLFLQGVSVTINQLLDISVLILVARHYGFVVIDKDENSQRTFHNVNSQLQDAVGELRSPVITIFGHVDHGKTTLLHAMRKTDTIVSEAGNITQAIGAHEVYVNDNCKTNKLIFLDTPGHEDFVDMRARGAQITDLAILVVAADDGLKRQTIEAINYIKAYEIPFVVAINKIDKLEANVVEVKKQLTHFDIIGEDLGGAVPIVEVSAINGKNVDLLLSTLLVLFQIQELKADPLRDAEGIILESHLDKKKGPIASVLIRNGTLAIGNIIVAGSVYGKVKAIVNNYGSRVMFVKPTSVVDIWGFSSVPDVGISFKVVANEKMAKSLITQCKDFNSSRKLLNYRISLDAINDDNNKKIVKQVNIILKTDVQGSIEALVHSFSKIPQEKVQINVLSASSGEISGKDIELANMTQASILTFKLNVLPSVRAVIKRNNIVLKTFNVIYDLVSYLKDYMLTFVDVQYRKETLGKAEVKTVFAVNKGMAAGCFVLEGKLKKSAYITVSRNQVVVFDGILTSLKRLKDDVEEVSTQYECGILCEEYHAWQKGDSIESYYLEPIEKAL